jgi:hypothetical protein
VTRDGRIFYFTSAAIIRQHLEIILKELRYEGHKRGKPFSVEIQRAFLTSKN